MLNVLDIYKISQKKAIEADPRGKAGVVRSLKIQKKKYDSLPEKDKNIFDKERLTNPYMDSRICYDSGKPIKKIMVGIDISTSEVLLADKLGVDLIISHHPLGNALANLDKVMHLQADLLHATADLPINVAEAVMRKRARILRREIHPINHHKAVDSAKILKISLMTAHTATDNLVWKFIDDLMSKKKPETVSDVVDILQKIPEYQEGIKRGEGPEIFSGEPYNRVGKLVSSEFTGGTEPGKELYEHLSKVGVGTVVGMHMGEDSRGEAEKYHINVVIAGHISSDSLGMNLLLDEIEKMGAKIIPCSGFIRIKR